MEEQRAHQRVQFHRDVVIEVDGREVDGVAVNVSIGGMYVESSEAVPIGSQVSIRCDLPTLSGAVLAATVRWRKPGGFGVQFGLLGAKETHALAEAVR